MNITTEVPLAAVVSYANRDGVLNETVHARAPHTVIAASHYKNFRFDQRIISWDMGRKRLRLKAPPMVHINTLKWTASMPEWGIEVGVIDAPNLPREMARRFLELKEKAADNLLTDAEAANWLHIVSHADMADYAQSQARPRYVEGKLLVKNEILKVLWHDNTESRIQRSFWAYFDLVNVGEEFTAYAKFGSSGTLLQIEDVIPRRVNPERTA